MSKLLEELKLKAARLTARTTTQSGSPANDEAVLNFTFEDITPSARRQLDVANTFVQQPLQIILESDILKIADALKDKSAREQLELINKYTD
tara:strand:- start:33 stop:308 length:276 start_codon:yes stop_codon:yes gene_type:complete